MNVNIHQELGPLVGWDNSGVENIENHEAYLEVFPLYSGVVLDYINSRKASCPQRNT